jgi:hypothetical protein
MQLTSGAESPSKNLRKRVLYSVGVKPMEWGMENRLGDRAGRAISSSGLARHPREYR